MALPSSISTDSGSLESSSPHTIGGHLHCVYPIRRGEGEGDAFQFDIMDSEDSSLFNYELALDDDSIPLLHEGKQAGLTIKAPYGMDSPPRKLSCFFEADNLEALQTDASESSEFGVEVDEERDDSFYPLEYGKLCRGHHQEDLPWSHPNSSTWIGREVPMLLWSLRSWCKSVGPTVVSLAPPGAGNSPNRIPPKAASPF